MVKTPNRWLRLLTALLYLDFIRRIEALCGKYLRDVPNAPSRTALFPLVASSSLPAVSHGGGNGQPKLFRVSNCSPSRPDVVSEHHIDLQNWLIPTQRKKPSRVGPNPGLMGRDCDYDQIASFDDILATSKITTGNEAVERHSHRVGPEFVQVEWSGLDDAVLKFKEKLWPNDTRLDGLQPRLQAVLSYQPGDSFGWHEDLCEERGQEGVLIVDLGFRTGNTNRFGTSSILGGYFLLVLGFSLWAKRCRRSYCVLLTLFLFSVTLTCLLFALPRFDPWRPLKTSDTIEMSTWNSTINVDDFENAEKQLTHNYDIENEFSLNYSSAGGEKTHSWSASAPGSWIAFHMHQKHRIKKIPDGRRRVVAVYTLVAPFLQGRFLCIAYSGSCGRGPYGAFRPGIPVIMT